VPLYTFAFVSFSIGMCLKWAPFWYPIHLWRFFFGCTGRLWQLSHLHRRRSVALWSFAFVSFSLHGKYLVNALLYPYITINK
jgi:hypothetical protein